MTQAKKLLYDRSRVVQDWKCGRSRYLQYELDGRGIVSDGLALELFMGSAIHDGLAGIAHGVGIDDIAEAANKQILEALMPQVEGEIDGEEYAKEQATLVEGLLRGFNKHVWPRLIAQYPNILLIEEELTYEHDGLTFMCKPDIVLSDDEGTVVYPEYKSTSSKKKEWIDSWGTAVQLHSTVRAIERKLEEKVTSVMVIGLYKGYCLEPSTPVLTAQLEWKQVGDLKVEDKLAGFQEQPEIMASGNKCLREWQEAKVTRTGLATLPCFEIGLADGTKFICSEDHQWLTAYELDGSGAATWTATKDLKTTHRIFKIIEPWKGTGEIESYDAGYLAAAFDGEGSLAQPQTDRDGKEYYTLHLQFCQNPNQMLIHMKSLMDKYGITWSGNDYGESRVCEAIQLYGKIKVLSLLGKIRPKRLLPKLDFNKLGMIKQTCSGPVRVVSITFIGAKEVVTLETNTGTLIANGFASHNSSYGKQNSPFCYFYGRPGNPPFSQDQVLYSYKAGFKRTPTWNMEGGVKAWVEGMPENLLAEQFPMTPPIFIKDDLIDRFFAQRFLREKEIDLAKQMLEDADEETRQGVMDCTFEQKFDQCCPGWGHPCPYRKICHGRVSNPLEEGFSYRVPHHALELKQQEQENV